VGRRFDYLIVGQGLAGSVLAGAFWLRGRTVAVVDENHRHAASLAAAGIINPVTGKRLNRPERLDEYLACAFSFYPRLEHELGARFFERRSILRLLESAADKERWDRQRAQPEFRPYLAAAPTRIRPEFQASLGGFEIERAAQLDVVRLLAVTRQRLQERGAFCDSRFDYDRLSIEPDEIRWGDWQARAIIFCEGYQLTDNPWFGKVQLNPAKGEVLTLTAPDFAETRIVQAGKWIFRGLDGTIRAGTNYSWDRFDEEPTKAARIEIETALQAFWYQRYEVVGQKAGVRPVTKADNRPLTGLHPTQPRLGILNGLGSKGCLQAPLVAEALVAKLETHGTIPANLDVCRNCLW
jgi:glycine/D-amino acid oxidase-like deaminating enzyme